MYVYSIIFILWLLEPSLQFPLIYIFELGFK